MERIRLDDVLEEIKEKQTIEQNIIKGMHGLEISKETSKKTKETLKNKYANFCVDILIDVYDKGLQKNEFEIARKRVCENYSNFVFKYLI